MPSNAENEDVDVHGDDRQLDAASDAINADGAGGPPTPLHRQWHEQDRPPTAFAGHAGNPVPSTPPESNFWFAKGCDKGRAEGFNKGLARGRHEGNLKGHSEGFSKGRACGRDEGYDTGFDAGLAKGLEKGKKEGFLKGREEGRDQGRDEAMDWGFNKGKEVGIEKALEMGWKIGWKDCYDGKNKPEDHPKRMNDSSWFQWCAKRART